MSTTRYLRDLRQALPRPFQHLVRDARRYYNDRKDLSTYRPEWYEGAELLTDDQIAEREGRERVTHEDRQALGYVLMEAPDAEYTLDGEPAGTLYEIAEREGLDTGYTLFRRVRELGYEYSHTPPRRYCTIAEEWKRTTKAELYQIRAEQLDAEATPGSARWMDLRFMELTAGSAQAWYEGIRDCTLFAGAAPSLATIEREVQEAMGQLCLFEAAGIDPAPSPATKLRERIDRRELPSVDADELYASSLLLTTLQPGANVTGRYYARDYKHVPFNTLAQGLRAAQVIATKCRCRPGGRQAGLAYGLMEIPVECIESSCDVEALEELHRLLNSVKAPRGRRDRQPALLQRINRAHNRKQELENRMEAAAEEARRIIEESAEQEAADGCPTIPVAV